MAASLSHSPQGQAQALFDAAEVEAQRFVLVAAPIGSGTKAQLNIYEQVRPTRPCFAVAEGQPGVVDPLLATFDFTGICSRYIDTNGYSLRVGGSDLATVYRLMVQRGSDDNVLLAVPTKTGAGPEMVVARTRGQASGFLRFELEPSWRLMRRQFRGRNLGHLYIYAESWPTPQAPAPPPPG
ncbi:MAG: DUF3747 domain-containing protein [Cyanobacteriota bacterium]|nr:DUF3747 domain-containing protein [Cyanobacteriota bacterium]